MDRLQQFWLQWSIPLMPAGMPGFPPNAAATLAIALVVGAAVGLRLGFASRLNAIVWLACLLLPLAYTLSATGRVGVAACDMSVGTWGLPAFQWDLDTRSNVLLMFPVGAATMLLPAGPRRLAGLAAALAVPVMIEMTQMLFSRLGRGCELGDVLNNQLGVLTGFWMVAGLAIVAQSVRVSRDSLAMTFGSRPGGDRYGDS